MLLRGKIEVSEHQQNVFPRTVVVYYYLPKC